jgi:hypothetical protein
MSTQEKQSSEEETQEKQSSEEETQETPEKKREEERLESHSLGQIREQENQVQTNRGE